MLSAPERATPQMLLVLGARSIPTGPNTARFLANRMKKLSVQLETQEPHPTTPGLINAPISLSAAETLAHCSSTKAELRSRITKTQNLNIAPKSAHDLKTSETIHAIPFYANIPPGPNKASIRPLDPETSRNLAGATGTSSDAPSVGSTSCAMDILNEPKDFEEAAVLFVTDAIEMVKRAELLATPIIDSTHSERSQDGAGDISCELPVVDSEELQHFEKKKSKRSKKKRTEQTTENTFVAVTLKRTKRYDLFPST
ncbi:hypothetical protein B0H10DRAFT_483988 [Mycena sp. CBHHK59/15]|nr:hypothetical protein B0H10DRAFT_483988 [Mycena sp. CBHHK59/15]